MAEDIRLAKGEEVDALKEEVSKKLDADVLDNEEYIKRRIVGVLPSVTRDFDFENDESLFFASNRCSAEVAEDDNGNKYQKITTAGNAANTYAFSYFDISEYTKDAIKVTVEFDLNLTPQRWYIGLSDLTARPGESYRTTYDSTGVIISQGTKDGNYYYINSDNTWKSDYFNKWVHSKMTVDFQTKTVAYEISNGNAADTLTGTIAFKDTSVEQLTGIEVFSYVNNVSMGIDNISITTQTSEEDYEHTIYLLPENGIVSEYVYVDGREKCVGRSDMVDILNDLITRVEALENA